MVFNKGGKWFGVLLACFIIFGASLVTFSDDVSAITKGYNSFRTTYNTAFNSTFVNSGALGYDNAQFNIHSIKAVSAKVTGQDSVPSSANFLSVTAKYNLVTFSDQNIPQYLPSFVNNPALSAVSINDSSVNFESSDVSVYVTDFMCNPLNAFPSSNRYCRTFTFAVSFVVRNNLPSVVNSLAFAVSWDDNLYLYNGASNGFNYYFEYDSNNKLAMDFSYDYTSALLNQQIQIQNITNNNITALNDTVNEYYEQNYDSVDNISNQTTNDIPNSTSSQTTSIIGVISGFISSLSSYQATSCSLTLPFPSYAGGSTTVDPCSGKEIAPTIVQIASSLLLICTFIPLAFVVLRMIYNEIRSWTNG